MYQNIFVKTTTNEAWIWDDKKGLIHFNFQPYAYRKDLRRLGEQFDQDSIMFIPKGQMGMLIGTNHCTDFPGHGDIQNYL